MTEFSPDMTPLNFNNKIIVSSGSWEETEPQDRAVTGCYTCSSPAKGKSACRSRGDIDSKKDKMF